MLNLYSTMNAYSLLIRQPKEEDMDGIKCHEDTCTKPRLLRRCLQVVHVGVEIYWPYRLG